MDGGVRGGQKWRPGVGRHAMGPGCMGVSRWLPPPPGSVSPGGETHRGAVDAAVGSRVAGHGGRVRVTRAVGLGHTEVGSPTSPWGAWTHPESIGDGAGSGVENLLHHIMGWEQ